MNEAPDEYRLETSRSGQPTLRLQGRLIHSRFDPEREAQRFLSERAPGVPRTFLVIGPGLGYLIGAIRVRYPQAMIASIQLCPIPEHDLVARADLSHQHENTASLRSFLHARLAESSTIGISVLVWEPVAELYRHTVDEVVATIGDFIQQSISSLMTQGNLGRRWIRNTIHGYLRARPLRFALTGPPVGAVVITAAGPSLERSVQIIRHTRDRVAVWATGSSLYPLQRAGIVPDLVMVTDASPYAALHLRPLLDLPGTTVVAPLAASRYLAGLPHRVVVSEATEFERNLPGMRTVLEVPPAGTVTASLYRLAQRVTRAPIVLAGADFCNTKGRGHARPHLNSLLRASISDRLRASGLPESQTDADQSPTLARYANWFLAESEHDDRISVLCPSPAWKNREEASERSIMKMPCEHQTPVTVADKAMLPDPGLRHAAVQSLLQGVRAGLKSANTSLLQPLTSELAVRLALPELIRYATQPEQEATTRLVHTLSDELTELEALL